MNEYKTIEKKFSVLDNMPEGVFIIRKDFTVVFWNRCLEEWTEIAKNEIVGTKIGTSFPCFNSQEYRSRIQTVFEHGTPVIFSASIHSCIIPSKFSDQMQAQYAVITPVLEPKGKERLALFSLHDVTDQYRQIQSYKKMYDRAQKEITERKKAENALRVSENKYKILVENLPQKIFLKDKNLTYISCNENYARDLNIKPYEIDKKTDYDFYPKALAEKHRTDDKRIIKSGQIEYAEEKRILRGKERWIHIIKIPVTEKAGGNIIGVLGIFWDITKRRKAENMLKESMRQGKKRAETLQSLYGEVKQSKNATLNLLEDLQEDNIKRKKLEFELIRSRETLRSTIDAISESAFLMGGNGKIYSINKSAAQKMGIDIKKLVYQNIYKMNSPISTVMKSRKKYVNKVIRSKKALQFEDTSSGKYFLNSVYPVFDEAGKVDRIVFLEYDITDRKLLEEKLIQTE
ncbi:MAG: PAS domain-containing protein, partial [Candidatus Theseobacter exili]|nr:PAS domain-containing protein [Candidatus Theseobacter exili]